MSDSLQKLERPAEETLEAKGIEKEMGFLYRNILGELMYAFVIARPDVGYAVSLLSRFLLAPHREHYKALKGVCRYHKGWGIIYHRPSPLSGLPTVPFEFLPDDPNLPQFP